MRALQLFMSLEDKISAIYKKSKNGVVKMKILIRYGFILGIICLLSAGLLAVVNAIAGPKILAQGLEQEQKTLSLVLPFAERFEAVKSKENEVIFYKGFDKDNNLIGVAFKAEAKGYSSVIETMAGITLDGKIIAIKVINQNETPGLGSKITQADFIDQFKGQNSRELGGVEAITGATVSSGALIHSVKQKAAQVLKVLEDGK